MPASRSLIALLVGTVVFFALWLVALKPSSSSNGGSSSSHGLGTYQTDINKAKHAVATSNASNAASGNENATSSSGGATASSHPSAKPANAPNAKSPAKTATKPTGSVLANALAAVELDSVKASLRSHKVVALLFFNPLAADDRAVLHELALVPTHKRHVVKLAVPLSLSSAFTPVTQQVPVNFSPTLMLISPDGQSSEVVGFATSFEISQRVDDALVG